MVLLVPLLIAIGIFIVFFFEIRNPKKREWIPEALLGVSITNFAICLWIFLYIAAIYENRSVAVEKKLGLGPIKHDQSLSPTEASNTEVGGIVETAAMRERELSSKGYQRQDKSIYILIHCLVPGLIGGITLFYFFALKEWCKPP